MTPQSSSPYRAAYAYAALLALLAATFAALVLSGSATAATRCGKEVLADWFDNGRIDRLYDLGCYEEAIDAIPSEIRDYSDAQEVISRALQAAAGGRLAPGRRGSDPGGRSEGPEGPPDPDKSKSSLEPEATSELDTSGPSSVPIPLLVLGGMSLALLAAGGRGYVSRRRRAQANSSDEDPH